MATDDPFSAFDDLRRQFRQSEIPAKLLLVDLVGSTNYKAQNPEITWITRLKKFNDTVADAVGDLGSCKYLGDAVLATFVAGSVSPTQVIDVASSIADKIKQLNEQFTGSHIIKIRTVINCGRVVLFPGNDPQGSAVDKLFRMEKYVPDGCVGLTEEFAVEAGRKETPVARYGLKGLPNSKGHGLVLIGESATPATIQRIRNSSRLASVWAQETPSDAAKILLVGGYIPGTVSTVQMGDLNAKLLAHRILASHDNGQAIESCDSSNFPSTGYSENIVSIGGPCFNSVSEALLANLPVEFENCDGDDDITPLMIKGDGTPIRLNVELENDRLTKDWGLFVRRRNPFNLERRTIVACGIESPAVEGIVRAFTMDNPYLSHLMERLVSLGNNSGNEEIPDFFCVMSFAIERGHHPVLPILEKQLQHIYVL